MDKTHHICGFCKRGKEVEKICGRMWYNGYEKVCAHQRCMQYSALLIQYEMKKFGGFKIKKVQKEINRGSFLRCSICSKDKKCKKPLTGATCGCAIDTCKKTFHFYCARTDEEACTKKIVYNELDEKSPKILYRVFCSKEHEDKFCSVLLDHKFVEDTDDEEYQSSSNEGTQNDSSSSEDSSSKFKLKSKKNGIKRHRMSYLRKHTNKAEEDGDSSGKDMPLNKRLKINTISRNDIVYIVCFLESSNTPDTKSMHILKKCAWKLFGVKGDRVFLWHYDGTSLTPYHIVYLLYDISNCISKKNYKELLRLMTQLNDEDIKCISDSIANKLTHDTDDNFYIQLRRKIAENLNLGKEGGGCMGKYCIVSGLPEKYVGFIQLDDFTDPHKEIRKAFGATFDTSKKEWVSWEAGDNLCKDAEDVMDAEKEASILHAWMHDNDIVSRKIYSYPTDEIITCSDQQLAIDRLQLKAQSELKNSKNNDGCEVVFIKRTVVGLVHFSMYAKRRVEKCVDDLLTARHDVIVFADVTSEDIQQLTDLVCPMRPEIVCAAYAAADVTKIRLSCAVLHFYLRP